MPTLTICNYLLEVIESRVGRGYLKICKNSLTLEQKSLNLLR
jgi:hypothetical protein